MWNVRRRLSCEWMCDQEAGVRGMGGKHRGSEGQNKHVLLTRPLYRWLLLDSARILRIIMKCVYFKKEQVKHLSIGSW